MGLHEFNNKKEEFPEITLEAFDAMNKDHIFSAGYQARKEKLLEAVRDKERRYKGGRCYQYRVAAAVAAAVVLIPGTVYAASQIYNITVQKEKYQTSVHVKKNEEAPNDKKYVPVKVDFHYLPEGCVETWTGEWKFNVPQELEEGSYAHSVSFNIKKMDVDEYTFMDQFSVDYKELTANEHPVILVQKDECLEFDKNMYVIFEEYGYVVNAFLGNGITEDEAIKIAKGITLTETDQEHAVAAESLKETLAEEAEKSSNELQPTEVMDVNNEWHEVGEWLEEWQEDPALSSGYRYRVTKVEVLDNIGILRQENFDTQGWEDLQEFVDAGGNLMAYERENITYGDGVNTVDTYGESETVQKKFVYLTLDIGRKEEKAENEMTDEYCVLYPIRFLQLKKDGEIKEREMNEEPVYFDASLTNHADPHYYWIKLSRGETVTCHLGYLVDEDRLEEMYLSTSPSGDDNVFIDIRQ
ncbi:DUF4367 domain-containing protein [Bariatricus sp. SGI.154]|uniref:DUF4367 domain-containing protein n=1 Tax=Bariatricus sp. SGI.154 TaxID=3420549 RepID=UPI003D05D91F